MKLSLTTLHVICGLDGDQTLIWSANCHQHITFLRPETRETNHKGKQQCFVSRSCFIKYQCSSAEEVSLRGIFHDCECVRGPSLSRMRCCATEKAVFYEDGWVHSVLSTEVLRSVSMHSSAVIHLKQQQASFQSVWEMNKPLYVWGVRWRWISLRFALQLNIFMNTVHIKSRTELLVAQITALALKAQNSHLWWLFCV